MTTQEKAVKKRAYNKKPIDLKSELSRLSEDELQEVIPQWFVITKLQPRHFDFLERFANQENRSIPSALERIVRIHYASDYTKGGKIMTLFIGGMFVGIIIGMVITSISCINKMSGE